MKNFISSYLIKRHIFFKFLLSVLIMSTFRSIFPSSLQFFFSKQRVKLNVSSSLSIKDRLSFLQTRLDRCKGLNNHDIQSFLSPKLRKVVPFLIAS